MFNIQGSEIVIILLLALVVLGPEKLPDAMRKLGKTIAELKKMSSGFQDEFKSVLDEPIREARETADLLRKSVDFTNGDLKSLGRADKPKSGSMADVTPPAEPEPAAASQGVSDADVEVPHEADTGPAGAADDIATLESPARPAGPAFHSASPRAMTADAVKVSAPFAAWPSDESAADPAADADSADADDDPNDAPVTTRAAALSPPAPDATAVLPPPPPPPASPPPPAPPVVAPDADLSPPPALPDSTETL